MIRIILDCVHRFATWLPPTQAMGFPDCHGKTPVAQMHFASELPLSPEATTCSNPKDDRPSTSRIKQKYILFPIHIMGILGEAQRILPTNQRSSGEGKMTHFWQRIMRAAKLDVNLYEEVEADRGALAQATGVVLVSSLAAGLGSIKMGGLSGVALGTVSALLGWYIWAYLTYLIGTKLLPEPQTHATHGELLRTIGFSSSPGLIRIVGIIPGLTGPVFLIAGVWMLVAMIVAVRQALDYRSTLRAVGVCLIGWLIQALFIMILFWIFGPGPGQNVSP
jgi:hypothetical protein